MKRKIIIFLTKYTSLFGFPTDSDPTLKRTRFILCSSLMALAILLCAMASFQVSSGNFYDYVKLISFTLILILIIVPSIATYTEMTNIQLMLREIDENIYTYCDESEIVPQYEWYFQEEHMIKICISLQCFNICIAALALFSPIIQRVLLGRVDMLVYPAWTPWNIQQLLPFIGIFTQQAVTIAMSIPWYTFAWIYALTVMAEYRRQCRRMNLALCTIQERTLRSIDTELEENSEHRENKRCIEDDSNYCDKYCENIISCINHYQKLLKTFDLFQPWWSLMFSNLLILNVANFAFSFYCLLEAKEIQVLIELNVSISSTFSILLTFCFIGEEFLSLNDEMKNVLFYEIQWYQQPKQIQKLLVIFHMLISRRPFELSGFSIFQASYRTFTYICRSSYQYLNVIKVSTRKH